MMQSPKPLNEADAQLLKSWVKEEISLQEDLAEMLSVMEGHIVGHDVAGLEQHLVTSTDILGRMEKLDQKRSKILGHLIRAAGIRGNGQVLERLVDLCPEQFKEELSGYREQLDAAGSQVRSRNTRNGMLARNAIEINEEIVRGVFQVDTKTATYDQRGGKTRHSEMILNRSI